MEIIHTNTYEDALREVERLRGSSKGSTKVHKIVKSGYGGFDVVAIEADLYVDLALMPWIDGLPPFPPFGNVSSGDYME